MGKVYTLGYFCYLCNEKNELIQQKNALYREAQDWKLQKHLGRADVCFDLYTDMKLLIIPKSTHIKEVGTYLKAKPIYNAQDYSIVAIEQRNVDNRRYELAVDTPARIKELAQQYIVEAIILGNFDGNITDTNI